MRAQVGDELIVESTVPAPSRRVGIVIGLKNADGSPPYLVHWVVGDYTSLIFPGPDTRMRVRDKAQHPGGAWPLVQGTLASGLRRHGAAILAACSPERRAGRDRAHRTSRGGDTDEADHCDRQARQGR